MMVNLLGPGEFPRPLLSGPVVRVTVDNLFSLLTKPQLRRQAPTPLASLTPQCLAAASQKEKGHLPLVGTII